MSIKDKQQDLFDAQMEVIFEEDNGTSVVDSLEAISEVNSSHEALDGGQKNDEPEDTQEQSGIDIEAGIFLSAEETEENLFPELAVESLPTDIQAEEFIEGSELEAYESAEIEELEFIEDERLESIIEAILFASDRPVSLAAIQNVFKSTTVKKDKIKKALDRLAVEFAGARRGVTLEEVQGGYQLRTKIDNLEFLKQTVKSKPFKLSGPALEVLAIVAYKQPVVKSEIDEIRGVESGHLLRALMEKSLVQFEGKSELPGRPMQYGTTRRFLEIFGLRNLKELPTLSQIDELLPEGIGEEEKKETLSMITDELSETIGNSYSQGEEELTKIQEQLEGIHTSSEFFEVEKLRQREKRDAEKAQDIRERIAVSEEVTTRDMNWLRKYDEALAQGMTLAALEAQEKVAKASVEVKVESRLGDDVTLIEDETSEESERFSEEASIEDADQLFADHSEDESEAPTN